MNLERRVKDYEQRVQSAGGPDVLVLGMVKAIKQTRRIQYLTVGAMIFLLGLAAVLGITVANTNKTAKEAAELSRVTEANRDRSLNNAKQANDIVRCLTKRKKSGKCLALTVPPGSPGSDGLRGKSGTPGLTGTPGPRGEIGPLGPSGSTGPPGPLGPLGPMGSPGRDGKNGAQGMDSRDGASGQRGETGATGPSGPQGDPGPAGPTGPAPTMLTCQPPAPDGTLTCTPVP